MPRLTAPKGSVCSLRQVHAPRVRDSRFDLARVAEGTGRTAHGAYPVNEVALASEVVAHFKRNKARMEKKVEPEHISKKRATLRRTFRVTFRTLTLTAIFSLSLSLFLFLLLFLFFFFFFFFL